MIKHRLIIVKLLRPSKIYSIVSNKCFTCSEPYQIFGSNCLTLSAISATWNDSQAVCKLLNGTLAMADEYATNIGVLTGACTSPNCWVSKMNKFSINSFQQIFKNFILLINRLAHILE
jgi:hypothetical protein